MNYVVFVIIFLCLIAGCQPNNFSHSGDEQSVKQIAQNPNIIIYANGLECVRVKGGHRYGLSCNWEKYNKEQEEMIKNENF